MSVIVWRRAAVQRTKVENAYVVPAIRAALQRGATVYIWLAGSDPIKVSEADAAKI
jgi:hypothetical protein